MTLDCATCQEWLDLEADGARPGDLRAPERAAMARHLEGCAACRAEREAAAAVHRTLAAARVPVRAGFKDEVMAALPAAGWEARSPRAWRLPLALFAALAGAAALLAGVGSARMAPDLPFLAALAALGGLFESALLAGAGLLAASWSGAGAVVGELVATSKLNLAAFVLLVAGVDVLLFSLLRRRTPAPEGASEGRRRHSR
jgi:hypothetical protein